VRIRQSVEFGITSTNTTADELATRIGIEPDRVSVKGSRITEPPIPRWHWWKIVCDENDLNIDEQIAKVLSRVKSHSADIAMIVKELERESPPGGAQLSIVRYFNDQDGADAKWGTIESSKGIEEVRGPLDHDLLGWRLSADDLGFLVEIGANIWVDEYDNTERDETVDSSI
jgi:Domain of unknown function (DUF4279)